MADRIIAMREKLYNKLVELNTPGEWGHIKSQIGQFPLQVSFSKLTRRNVLLHRLEGRSGRGPR
jgi:aspartate aminotransferase